MDGKQQQQQYQYQSKPAAGQGANANPKTQSHTAFHDLESARPTVRGIGGNEYNTRWERDVRLGFIRKVFGILTVQLIVTFAGAVAFSVIPYLREEARNLGVLISAYVGMIAVMCAIACCKTARRTYPLNYFLLALFTLFSTYFVAVVSSFYSTFALLIAMGMTIVISIGLIVFALQTKIDFTLIGGGLFIALMVLIMFSFLQFFFYSHFLDTLIAAVGAIIFGIYIIYDVQLMVGGKHHAANLSPDEYIFAALSLYLDVINFFLFILQLVGGGRR